MKTNKTLVRILLAAILSLTWAAIGYSQATRTWVSGVGDDANPCSRTAPCKTFAGAISKTAAGGEIDALDPGGYGTVTITKSITIDGGPGVSSILASGTNGINIVAGPTDVVTIRNISINGAGTVLGPKGINYTSAGAVLVENVTIKNFTNNLIDMNVTATGRLVVRNLIGSRTTGIGPTDAGIRIQQNTVGAVARVHISNSILSENALIGILIGDRALVDIKNTEVVGQLNTNSTTGVYLKPAAGVAASVNLEGCEISHHNRGLTVTGDTMATAFISNTGFYYNGVAIYGTGSAQVTGFGNNRFGRNTTKYVGVYLTQSVE